jgi:transcription elongation GreA/GreB family factor
MSIRSIRERASARLLRTGTELAIDQREIEERLAAASVSPYSSAYSAVTMARWVDSAVLWLGWRLLPRTYLSTTTTPGFSRR